MNLFRSIRTVATITASLATLVNDLEMHADERLEAQEASEAEAAKLTAEAFDHGAEATKASEVALRIRALIG